MEQTKIEQLLWVGLAILPVIVIVVVVLPPIWSTVQVTSRKEDDCYHSPKAAKYIKRVRHRFDEWGAAKTLAGPPPLTTLPKVVAELQQIREMSAGLKYPYCAETVHKLMITYMDESIDAYVALLARESDAEVRNKFLRAELTFLVYRTSLSALFDNLSKLYLPPEQRKDKLDR